MAAQLALDEWKRFLKARIVQEQGNDQEALTVFEELLIAHPNNPHLISSRAFALQRLGRNSEATASRLEAKYAALGTTLLGKADDPEVWTANLKSLLGEVDKFDTSGTLGAAMIVW